MHFSCSHCYLYPSHCLSVLLPAIMRLYSLALVLLHVTMGLCKPANQSWVFAGTPSQGYLGAIHDPGLCDTVKQYAGYYNINSATQKQYFFWAFESRQPTNKTILWMTGGPGCSSELALFVENGPCSLDQSGTQTTTNPWSWNTNANLIYIDQPAGTGFSTSTRSGWDHNEAEVAEDMYHFLQALFADHPLWAQGDFYIFGESYAGHYVPATAHRVWQGNRDREGLALPLRGVAVGNGLTDPEIQYAYYPQMAYNYSIAKVGKPCVSLEAYKAMVAALPKCLALIHGCQTRTMECALAQGVCNEAMLGAFQLSGLNTYDIRIPCKVPGLCYDFSQVKTFLDSPTVQQRLGVSMPWASCNFDVNRKFASDWMKRYEQLLPDLLGAGIPVLIYAGDVDFICNWLGNKAWTLALDWPGKQAFYAAQDLPWKVAGKTAGELRSAGGFHFLRVYDAGHMVPMDQPQAALQMVQEFISGKI